MAARGQNPASGTVYLIEDDAALGEALLFLLSSRGIVAEHFDGAEAFLASIADNTGWPGAPACLLLDVRMRGMSGLELFERLLREHPQSSAPVVFLTGHGDIGMAVDALKRGAFDFFEKPFNDNRLADRLLEALAESAQRLQAAAGAASVEARTARLSNRERDVMTQVLAGKPNKLIAYELGISMRTVEVHRANIFAKMGVRSAVELAAVLAGGST